MVWCGVGRCGVVWCGVAWCAEAAFTKRQWPGCLAYGHSTTGRGVCVCARCVAPVRLLGSLLRPAGIPCCSACRCRCSFRRAHTMVSLGPAGALHTVSLPCGSRQWDSCIPPPHCPGAVGGGSPATEGGARALSCGTSHPARLTAKKKMHTTSSSPPKKKMSDLCLTPCGVSGVVDWEWGTSYKNHPKFGLWGGGQASSPANVASNPGVRESTTPRHITPHHSTSHHTIPHHTALHRTTPNHSPPHPPHHTTPHHTTPHHTTPHHTTPHRTAPHRTAPHHTAPHGTARHRTAPHHTAPHHTTPHHTLSIPQLSCVEKKFENAVGSRLMPKKKVHDFCFFLRDPDPKKSACDLQP